MKSATPIAGIIFVVSLAVSRAAGAGGPVSLLCDVPGLSTVGNKYTRIIFNEASGVVDGHRDGQIEIDSSDSDWTTRYYAQIDSREIKWGWTANNGQYSKMRIDRGTGEYSSVSQLGRLHGKCDVEGAAKF
jgi:hypothetical protein